MRPDMPMLLATLAGTASAAMGMAATDTFDGVPVGGPPVNWTCGVTGGGSPKWTVERDASAPTPPNVLKQSGAGKFPWCVKTGVAITDGFVEVRFKPIAGREDRAGGVVWRFRAGDNYYVARANALEGNVSVYHTERGRRMTIKYVAAPVAPDQWHQLRVEFTRSHIKVYLDGKTYVDLEDHHITGPGSVGVWTKADSVTAFDDFSFGGK